MQNIIYIADPEILAVPIVECGDPLIDIKDFDELFYGPVPECELTADCYTKMRKTIFEKLCLAQKDLPSGWRFRIYEGYRSLKVQQMLFEQEYQRVVERFPLKNNEEHFHETTRLVSPVTHLDGTKNIPPHSTGAAVDVEIINEDGELIDMGMECKDWIDVPPDLCMTQCSLISMEAQRNRKILYDALYAHDFINYPTEWWHFSYGDRYWAYHKKVSHAVYGTI